MFVRMHLVRKKKRKPAEQHSVIQACLALGPLKSSVRHNAREDRAESGNPVRIKSEPRVKQSAAKCGI